MSYFHESKFRTGRKPHKCEYCGRTIKPREKYSYEHGRYEGAFYDYAMCLRCRDVWPMGSDDTESLGNFWEQLCEARIVLCPECGSSNHREMDYDEDVSRLEVECECGCKYTFDLSAENIKRWLALE